MARFPRSLRRTAQPAKTGAHTSAINDPLLHYLGITKQWASETLAAEGLTPPRGVWATKGKIKPVGHPQHQLNVYRYIIAHIDQGTPLRSVDDREMQTNF